MTTRRPARALPDDRIIDPIAVKIAAHGTRLIALTPAEQRRAAARIPSCGGKPAVISRRLHVSGTSATRDPSRAPRAGITSRIRGGTTARKPARPRGPRQAAVP